MEHNGLPARSFVAVADVATSDALAVLQALREQGVAAYVAAATTGAEEADLRRLWVDGEAVDLARTVLAALDGVESDLAPPRPAGTGHTEAPTSGLGPDDEAAWRQLVAAFEADAVGEGGWPAAEDVATTGDSGPRPGRLLRRAEPPAPSSEDPADEPWESEQPAEPEDDGGEEPEAHFVPPTPPPLSPGDAVSRFAWAGVVGGPGYLFVAVLTNWAVPPWAAALAIIAFVAGFLVLVSRLRDDDTDGGNGAVV